MSKKILGYWNYRGYGQPIRFLLKYLKINFEEKLYELNLDEDGRVMGLDKWFIEDKYNLGLDFPSIPYFIDGEIKITESTAIIKHLCREYDTNLLGKDSAEERQLDILQGVIWDLVFLLTRNVYSNSEESIENYAAKAPEKLSHLSKFLGKKQFFLGSQVKYVDFLAYEFIYQNKVFDQEILTPFQNLEKFLKNFEALPSIKEYLTSGEIDKYPRLYSLTAKVRI